MKNKELVLSAIEQIKKGYNKEAIEKLNSFMLLNEKAPTTKINIFDWCSKEKYRKPLLGVFHNCTTKEAVATDGVALIASTLHFVEPNETTLMTEGNGEHNGYIITKKGEYIDDVVYPNYSRIIPEYSMTIEIDKTYLAETIRKLKATGEKRTCAINVTNNDDIPIFLQPKYVQKLITLPDDGTFTAHKNEYGHKPLVFKSKTITALFLPYMYGKNMDYELNDGIIYFN